jgi:hypothetical protein
MLAIPVSGLVGARYRKKISVAAKMLQELWGASFLLSETTDNPLI